MSSPSTMSSSSGGDGEMTNSTSTPGAAATTTRRSSRSAAAATAAAAAAATTTTTKPEESKTEEAETRNDDSAGRKRRSRSSTPANGESSVSTRTRGGGGTNTASDTTTTSSKNGRSNGTDPSDQALSNVHYLDSAVNMEVDTDNADETNKQTNNYVSVKNCEPESVQQQQIKCKLCGRTLGGVGRTVLESHALEVHLSEVQLMLNRGLDCPECSFKAGDNASLASHFVSSHDLWEKCDKLKSKSDVDESDGSDNDGQAKPQNQRSSSNSPKPGKQPRTGRKGEFDKPRNFAEFSRQVQENLRTEDGKFATAVDERAIRCVCGKVVRTCGKYYWRYLVQRPTIKNGQVIQKGHWFTCATVAEFKSCIPPWPVSQEELEASKAESSTVRRNGIESVASTEDSVGEKRRAVRKRVPVDKESQPTLKRSRDDDDSDDSDENDDDEEDDEIDPDIGETQARYRVKKWVTEKMALRVPGDVFLQDGPCFQVVHDNVLMCHTCKFTSSTSRLTIILKGSFNEMDDEGDISCSFYAFRKLKCSKSGHVTVAGYLDPQRDPRDDDQKNDVAMWVTRPQLPPHNDVAKAKFILSLIGDQFCDMVRQEQKCLALHADQQPENRNAAWKPSVRMVREMCDVCKTTLFNFHWTCARCGIFICLDCYQFRVGGLVKDACEDESNGDSSRWEHKDEYNWPYCTNGETHNISRLLIAQIIPKNLLVDLAIKMHNLRLKWNINQFCHGPDDLDNIFSTETLQKFAVSSSKINPERASKLYVCQFCPGSGFKWQSCLYKHWVFKHFNDEIRLELPELPPFNCPKCDYVAANKTMLLLHYGITHKVVVRFVEKSLRNQGIEMIESAPVTTSVSTPIAISTSTKRSSYQSVPALSPGSAFKCPLCTLTLSPDSRSDHLSKHFYDSLSADLPIAIPFTCPKCRFVGMDRMSLLRHYGSYHGMSDKYLKEHLTKKGQDVSNIIVRDRGSEVTPKKEIAGGIECRLCERDDAPFLKNKGDLHRHLSETHFSERLLRDLENVSTDVKPYKCNRDNCDFTALARSILLVHLGLFHRCAVKYYCEVLGISDEEEDGYVKLQQRSLTSSNPISIPSTSQPFTKAAIAVSTPASKHNPDLSVVQVCPICRQRFGPDALLFHVADQHFRSALDEARVPSHSPYKCPACPHCSQNRLAFLQHWFIFHKMMDTYTGALLGRPSEAMADPHQYSNQVKEESQIKDEPLDTSGDWGEDSDVSHQSSISGEKNSQPQKKIQCLMCDDVKLVGVTPLDLHKHLVEKHFRDRMLALIPCTGTSPEGKPKYSCPFPGCSYEHHYKWIIAKHYGVKHRIAKQFYEEIIGLRPPCAEINEHPVVQEVQIDNPKPDLKIETSNIVSEMMPLQQQFPQANIPSHVLHQIAQQPHFQELQPQYLAPQSQQQQIFPHQQELQPTAQQLPQPHHLQPVHQLQPIQPTSQHLQPVHQSSQYIQAPPQQQQFLPSHPPQASQLFSAAEQPQQLQIVQQPLQTVIQPPSHHAIHATNQHLETVQEPSLILSQQQMQLSQQVQQPQQVEQPQQPEQQPQQQEQHQQTSMQVQQSFNPEHQVPDQPQLTDGQAEEHTMENENEYSLMTLSSRLKDLDDDDEEEEDLDDCDLDETLGLSTSESELAGTFGNSLEASIDESFSGQGESPTYNCKICAVKSRGITEYLRHLSKVHFKNKLLSFVPKTAPFRCPAKDCEVTKKDRFNIALHYGMTHKVALNLMQDMPEDALSDEVEATCKICHQSFTAHRYLYTHLSDTHFAAELDAELPKSGPWKCPRCSYIGNDPRALRVHFGVRHKIVLDHLAKSLGMDAIALKKEMKAGRRKAVSALKATIGCKYCPTQFKDSVDLNKHIVLHLKNTLYRQLPDQAPFKCPNCEFVAPHRITLLLHFGTGHPAIVKEISSQPTETLDIDMSFVDPQILTAPEQKATPRRGGGSAAARGQSQVQSQCPPMSQPNQRQMEEDKKFPKCRICNYRYFSRLDLCRHFVDFHLRSRLANCLDPNSQQCPGCTQTYEKPQARLRHYVWKHQDLEQIVHQAFNVRVSECMPSARDLESAEQKNERGAGAADNDVTEVTDLSDLPVNERIDLKLTIPSCELCGEEFKTSVNKARDKSVHLLGHFREEVMKDLPRRKPYKCPKCTFVGRDVSDLSRHFGLSHRVIFALMQRELGESWDLDENETNDCKVCGQVFANIRLLSDHYCAQHFYQKLAEGLPTTSPFKCPQCNFQSKTQLALVRHVGAKHIQIKSLLEEEGISGNGSSCSEAKSRSSSSSQDMPASPGAFSEHQLPPHISLPQLPTQPQPQQVIMSPPQQQQQQQPAFHPQLEPLPPSLPQQNPPNAVNPYEQQPWQQQQQQQTLQQPQQQMAVVEQRPTPHQYGAYLASPYHQPQYTHQLPPPQQQQQQQQQQHYPLDQHPGYDTKQQTYQNFPQQQQLLMQHPQPPHIDHHNQQLQEQHQQQQHLQCPTEQVIKQEPLQHQQQQPPQQPLYKANSNANSNKSDPSPVACPICQSTFLNSVHFIRHAADKHFMERLRNDLPHFSPFKCPLCPFEGKDLKLLVRHYGMTHKMVLKLLNERAGIHDSYDESILRTLETHESNRETCPLCSSNFGGRYMLLRHLADCHFRERLCQGVQHGEVYKCPFPDCNHSSKDKGGFVRHYGLVHKMVQKWLREMGIHGFDEDSSKKSGGGVVNRHPMQSTPLHEMDKSSAEQYQEFCDTYEPNNVPFFDSPNSVGAASFAPPSTPSSTASFGEPAPSVYVTQNVTTAGNRYYLSPPAMPPTSAPQSVSYDPSMGMASSVQQQQQQQHQYSPAVLQRPASQPPPRPYSSSSNPLTSPIPHQQQTSPQNLSREGGYPSPQTPGSGYGVSGSYDSHYGQPQDLSRPQAVDFTQGPQYFSQPNGPVGRPMPPQQQQQQRYHQQPAQTLTPQPMTPQPMTPQPMTPGSHGGQTPQPPVTPHDGGMISPAPYPVGITPTLQNPNYYNAQQIQQQQIVQARPQHGGLVQHQQQQQMFGQPQQPLSRPVTLQPLDSAQVASPPSPPSPTPVRAPPKSNSRSHTYVPPGDDFIEAPTPEMKAPYAIMCNFCRSIHKNKSDFYRHLSERHFKTELARELPQQPPYDCPLAPCTYSGKETLTALVKHYGIVHKGVQKYLNGQIAGRYIHHDKNAPASSLHNLPPTQQLPTQQQQEVRPPEMVNGMEQVQQQHQPQQQQLPEPQQAQQQVMSNQALKVKCPFCELMFAARYAFYQHLCDKHFKENLAKQVPVHPPYQCPVGGCAYIARDSRQSLIRHFGMTHKVIVELLKRHAPDYETIDPFPNDEHHQHQQQLQHQQPQHQVQQVQHQVEGIQQQQLYYQHPAPQPQHQFTQQHDMQDAMMTGYYHQEYQTQPQQMPQHQAVHQQPHIGYGQQQHQQHSGDHSMRFEPQIDGTFDPSHYSDHSLDGIRSVPTTPIKIGSNIIAVMPPPPTTAVDATEQILLSSLASEETELLSSQPEEPKQETVEENQSKIQVPSTPSGSKASPKICEICGKQFEGKNRAMLKVQHMANHFKDKLFADLKDKSAPFKCPMEGCSYQTKHKPDWARHYGSVHQFIGKYLKEYLDLQQQQQPQPQQIPQQQQHHQPSELSMEATSSSSSSGLELQGVTDGERTYSAFLPKADLHQILTTAMNQQSQPGKNFGVVTINAANAGSCLEPDLEDAAELNFVEQVIQHSTKFDSSGMVSQPPSNNSPPLQTSNYSSQQCFMCLSWFKDEKDLTDHMAQHIELSGQQQHPNLKTTSKLEVLSPDDLEASLLVKSESSMPFHLDHDLDDLPNMDDHMIHASTLTAATTSTSTVPSRSTGRPCEICGFEPKTKNKSRERQDHLAMKHYRERIQSDLAAAQNYKCPLCEYIGKDKQTIYRHYTGKHKVVEQYLADDLAAGRVIPLSQQHQQQQRPGIPSLPTAVESLPILQNFDLEGNGGLDLTVHSLVDSRVSLAEFMDQDHVINSQERIMQVDGAEDIDENDGDFDADVSDDSSNMSFTGTRCPICDEPTKMHKSYHLASRHFKQRLGEALANAASTDPLVKGFKCPDCHQDFKTRINLWTHYLGKHRYGDKWTAELLAAQAASVKQEGFEQPSSQMSPAVSISSVTAPSPVPMSPIVKSEPVTIQDMDSENEKVKTPKKCRTSLDGGITSSAGKRLDFWCDLCQSVISNLARIPHFANVHFESRLKRTLPTSGHFSCPLCRHEGKNFLNLSTHFLGKHHEYMKTWMREELDKLETLAFEKMSSDSSSLVKHESDDEMELSDVSDQRLSSDLHQALHRLTEAHPELLKRFKVQDQQSCKRQKISDFDNDDSDDYYKVFRLRVPTGRDPIPSRTMTLAESSRRHPTVPHTWLCNGKLLILEDPMNPDNINLFQEQWIRGQPVIVANVSKHLNMDLWSPESFSRQFGHIRHDIVNTKSNKIIPKVPLKMFWDGFDHLSMRMKDELDNPMLLKLKDWPPDNDFSNYLPERFADLMKYIPLPDYTRREGRLNLASSMPDFFVRPDLGPKMYIAYGNALYPNTGTTNLHIDMSDACNVMVYVSIPKDGNKEEHIREGLKSVEEADCDILTRERVREGARIPGAIWHIYHPRDADKIRDLLNKVALEKGQKLEPNTDPIHDQNVFLDSKLRQRLYTEYGVVGYAYPQCEGDTVFIPAGAPHQVRNVHNCIKVAEDFVSPENLEWCFYQTEEFRHLSEGHTNHEDKLQIKNILYHAVKDCLSVLENHELQNNGLTC